jgi:hypothetical protein
VRKVRDRGAYRVPQIDPAEGSIFGLAAAAGEADQHRLGEVTSLASRWQGGCTGCRRAVIGGGGELVGLDR